jgi:hypothetical protein
MACEEAIVQCTMNHPTVAAVGLGAGFIIAKALAYKKRMNSGMGGGFGGGL